MIGRQEILEFARDVSLDSSVVEKDYVLGWMLAGVSENPRTRDAWVFKGGTCLKKCYFETYRFSEDLDFTLLDGSQVDGAVLRDLLAEITQWVYDESGIAFPAETRTVEVYRNPRGNNSAQGRIGYRGPLGRVGDPPRIRFDLTNDERVVLPPERRPVHHPYSDRPEAGLHVLAYCFEEVFAEKMRALAERQRPRDLYDVIHLRRHDPNIDRELVRSTLAAKCEFKGIAVPTFRSLLEGPQHAEIQSDWEQMLAHQLAQLPPFKSFWDDLPEVFSWLEKGEEKTRLPTMGALRADLDTTWHAPAMAQSWRSLGIGAPLETIRFAAVNHLCVELDYRDEKGNMGTRTVEPYSLRRTKAGEILFYAVRSADGQDRSYRIDRIVDARITKQSFTPRYVVELGHSELLNAAPPVAKRATIRKPVKIRPAGRRTKRASAVSGPKYVFRCSVCGKKFQRSTYDATLKPHKGKQRYPCPGRVGYYETTKY